MKYLLDSDIISDFYDRKSKGHAKIAKRLASMKDSDQVQVSILAIYEQEYGYSNAPEEIKSAIRQKILKTKESFNVLPISSKGAKVFGELKKSYKDHRQITSKETMKKLNIDIILASTAIVESCILVSPDNIYSDLEKLRKDFKYENWFT